MSEKRVFVMVWVMLLAVLSILVGGVQSQASDLPLLTGSGPYGVRLVKVTFTDEHRLDWNLEVRVWYPADKSQGTPIMKDSPLLKDAPPDRSGAPYPLILFSHGTLGNSLDFGQTKAHLASYGYVVAAMQHHDTDPASHELVDRSLDILTTLDGLAAIPDGDLAGMIDTNNVGLMGFSQGGDAVFQMLGLLSDPVHYVAWCAEHPELNTPECTSRDVPLDQITAYRAQLGLTDLPDGRWQPFGDARIHAVLALSPCDFPLTTDDMLPAVTTPTMIIHGTLDSLCDYEGNAVRTYTHLGTEDHYLISLIKGDHMTLTNYEPVLQHFATAFFGRYLQGEMTYTPYLTRETLTTWNALRLAWGPYEGE